MGDRQKTISEWIRPPDLEAWYLSGPTASGKTAIAHRLAERLQAEIISLDSMAVYRGMDIGTAKPTAVDRSQAQYHLIDVVDPTEEYSVSRFVDDAHRTASEIRQRGKQVLFVGGTPLYLKSLLRGLFLGPPADPEFRHAVEEDLKEYGIAELHKRLWQVDPLSAHKIHPNDSRRMIRALEVARATGMPLSHWQSQFENGRSSDQVHVIVLGVDRKQLHDRINSRVDQMFERGLIDEARELLDRYGELGNTARQAVGYREVFDHLRGATALAETVEQVKAHTRQFARRQEIWFRSLSECRRIEVAEYVNTEGLVDAIIHGR